MNAKTIEGLVGARTNMNLTDTPMRVFKDARRRGDTSAMERAMGYVNEFSEKAEEYKAEADRGMEEDAEKAREKTKAECEKAVQRRREERREQEECITENTDTNIKADIVEISEEGKELLRADAAKEPVIYTKTETAPQGQSAVISITV